MIVTQDHLSGIRKSDIKATFIEASTGGHGYFLKIGYHGKEFHIASVGDYATLHQA